MALALGVLMRVFVAGALLACGLAMVSPAAAAPGQCLLTGFESFPCDVVVDGASLAFDLPDGRRFAVVFDAAGQGTAFARRPDAAPGTRPDDLGRFEPVEGEPGCWQKLRLQTRFCVMVESR